jgi:hypothetical protein
VTLSSGTLPNTGFCAEVWTCPGNCTGGTRKLPLDELELESEFESWAKSAAGKTIIDHTIMKATPSTASETLREKTARRHSPLRVKRFAKAMDPGVSP